MNEIRSHFGSSHWAELAMVAPMMEMWAPDDGAMPPIAQAAFGAIWGVAKAGLTGKGAALMVASATKGA
eukprot:7989119-Prorocentrum_lima.AAC.1